MTGLDPAKIFTYQETPRIDLKIPPDILEYYRVFSSPAITDAFVDDVRDGIREPLRIITDGDRAVLRDGHHRLAAIRKLKMSISLPIHVVPNWLGNLYTGVNEPPGVEPVLAYWLNEHEDTFTHVEHTQTEVLRNTRLRLVDCSCGAQWRESL